jgi:hypothetical protein
MTAAGVRLHWTTLSEINNYGFYVERRSSAQTEYRTIPNSFVPGHGTTNQTQNYESIDSAATSGIWFYRLRQLDLDSSVHLTEPILVQAVTTVGDNRVPGEFSLMQNFPNPFNPTTRILFTVDKTGPTKLEIYNVLGKKLHDIFDDFAEAGRLYAVTFSSIGLSSGVYYYELSSGLRREVRSFVITK